MYLLEYVGNLPLSDRNSPIKIARHLSSVLHDANGYGVLQGNNNIIRNSSFLKIINFFFFFKMINHLWLILYIGNWTENFSDGRAPSSWLNSKEILSQYLKTKRSVKFAQCWNFAGALCTCLRTLGIASRIVTCYLSAHDTQGSLTVDRVLNENLEHLKDKSQDSVWNFHTWVESWWSFFIINWINSDQMMNKN